MEVLPWRRFLTYSCIRYPQSRLVYSHHEIVGLCFLPHACNVRDLCSTNMTLISNYDNPFIVVFRLIICSFTCILLQALKKLLFKIEDHNALDSNGDAPLHCYVKRRDKERFNCLITFLIYSKCDINFLNIEGQTALHLGCKVSHSSFLLVMWWNHTVM